MADPNKVKVKGRSKHYQGKSDASSVLRPGKTARLNATAPDGTVKKNPWKGIPAGDRQGMREAIALRYGKPDPAVDAMRRR